MLRFRLKELREKRGMSQQQLARAIGEAQSTVGGWESGRGGPRYATLLKLADYFGVSLDYLTGRSKVEEITVRRTEDMLISEHERALILSYRRLTPREQSMICKQLDLTPPVQEKKSSLDKSGGTRL